MHPDLLKINPHEQKKKIVAFIKATLEKQGFKKVVIGCSGGVDSTTCLYLLKETLPEKNIIAVSLPYFQIASQVKYQAISIKKIVDTIANRLRLDTGNWKLDKETRSLKLENPASSIQHQNPVSSFKHPASKISNIRLGNIMVRVRMIILYDLAKKNNALVCGTENKSEYLLGYFTRFGDSASDFEPIRHLYKTQVYQLASYLKVPEEVIKRLPTAGLWSGQTDEGEFGFSYQEADQVLASYFDKKISVEEIEKQGFKNARKIINFSLKNQFKHQTPYSPPP